MSCLRAPFLVAFKRGNQHLQKRFPPPQKKKTSTHLRIRSSPHWRTSSPVSSIMILLASSSLRIAPELFSSALPQRQNKTLRFSTPAFFFICVYGLYMHTHNIMAIKFGCSSFFKGKHQRTIIGGGPCACSSTAPTTCWLPCGDLGHA